MIEQSESDTKGIEFSLIDSWEGWDEHGISDLLFYNVKLKPDVFGEDFIKKYEGKRIDLGLWLSTSCIEIFVDHQDEPVLVKNIKVVLE